MSDELLLPMVPEPNLTPAERRELRARMDDPGFWDVPDYDCAHCGDGDALRSGEACAYCGWIAGEGK